MSHILTCEEVDKNLVFYLDQALSLNKRLLIEQHLAGCSECQGRLAATTAARKSMAEVLQSLAGKAEPPAQAWEELQSRLARETQRAPARNEGVWQARKAREARRFGRTSILHTLTGVKTMKKRTILNGFMAVVVVAVVGILLTQAATPVSAQQVLEKAYLASSKPQAAEGIRHMRSEHYTNRMLMSPGNWAETVARESYSNLANGIYRSISTDAETGELLSVTSYDGSYWLTNRESESLEKGKELLTLYRTPQSIDKITDLKPITSEVDAKAVFENMKKQAKVIAVSKETRPDGRKVFVLRSNIPDGAGSKFGIEGLAGESVVVVDAETYELLEDSMVMKGEDGQETVLYSYRLLINEILPAGSDVAWDLLDVEGIFIVEDPDRIYGDLLPEKLTPAELATHTAGAYLLKSAPEGFDLTLSAPPQQEDGSDYYWMANYRNAAGDYILVHGGGEIAASVVESVTDTYQTASGLSLRIEIFDENLPEGIKPDLNAFVDAPDGTQFTISSNLPREKVEELAEELEPVK